MALSVIFLCIYSGRLHTAIYSGNLLTNYVNSILITHSVERALLTRANLQNLPANLPACLPWHQLRPRRNLYGLIEIIVYVS